MIITYGQKHLKYFFLVPAAIEMIFVIFKTLKNVNQFKMTTLFSVLHK